VSRSTRTTAVFGWQLPQAVFDAECAACVSVTYPKANQSGLNRRTLYASKLHSWTLYALHLETGAEPLYWL
jgi:hypothetical protein